MKDEWKRIDIVLDEDGNVISAEVDGMPTKEFNKENDILEKLLSLFNKSKKIPSKDLDEYFELKTKCKQALKLQELVKEEMEYDSKLYTLYQRSIRE